MNISFQDRKTRREFDTDTDLRRAYGAPVAKSIKIRMAILKNARHLGMVSTKKPTRCHQLIGKRKEQFAVDLNRNWRLVFKPDHGSLPRKDDGGIDLEQVTKIKILEVEDYHK